MGVEQVELLQEEVDSNHQEEYYAQEGQLTGGNVQKLLKIVVVKLFLWFCRSRLCLLSGKSFKNFVKRTVAAHAGEWVVSAVIAFFTVKFRLLLRSLLFLKHIRRMHGQQDRVVNHGNYNNQKHHADKHFVELF